MALKTKSAKSRIWKRDKGVCGICGHKIKHKLIANVDHIKPRSLGGSDDDTNLQIAHISCNSQKDNSWEARDGD